MTKDELIAAILDLDPLPESDDIWTGHRQTLRNEILHNDLDNFLQWAVIQATMFVGDAPWIENEIENIFSRYSELSWIDEWGLWEDALKEPKFGNPPLIHYPRFLRHPTSGNLIHQAYHLKQWQDRAGLRVEDLGQIVEIGGGYGATALVAKGLYHPDTQYAIVDFPEFSLLQKYYLSNTIGSFSGITLTQDIGLSCDLLIACHSISEMSIEIRNWILQQVKAKSYLFVFHCEHDHIDNIEYFTDFMKLKTDYQWWQWATPHLPNQYYQIGIAK